MFNFIVALLIVTSPSFTAETLLLLLTVCDLAAAVAACCGLLPMNKDVVKHLPAFMVCRHFHSFQYRGGEWLK